MGANLNLVSTVRSTIITVCVSFTYDNNGASELAMARQTYLFQAPGSAFSPAPQVQVRDVGSCKLHAFRDVGRRQDADL